MAPSCAKGGSQGLNSTDLVVPLLQLCQGEHVVRAGAQHIWPHTDRQVAGVHLAGLHVFADVTQHSEQALEQQEVCCGQAVGHPREHKPKGRLMMPGAGTAPPSRKQAGVPSKMVGAVQTLTPSACRFCAAGLASPALASTPRRGCPGGVWRGYSEGSPARPRSFRGCSPQCQ